MKPETLELVNPKDQQLVEEVFEHLKQGAMPLHIYQHLLLDHPKLKETRFKELLDQAYKYGEIVLHKDREYLFMLHVSRYEELYRSCRVLVDHAQRPLDPAKHWAVIVQKLRGAMKALKSKEDLLGLHDRKMVLELIDHQAFVVEQEAETHGGAGLVAGLDLAKLSIEEVSELLKLLQAARLTPPNGVQRVLIKQHTLTLTAEGTPIVTEETSVIDDVKTIDTEFAEELPEDVLAKLEQLTRADTTEVTDPNFVDDVPKRLRGVRRTAEEVKQQLNDQHQELANRRQALERLRGLRKKD